MRLHIIGGSGFLGGHVVPLLVGRGHAVTALARSVGAADRIRSLGATPVPGDLDDLAALNGALAAAGAEALICLASLGFGHAPAIVNAAENVGIRRAVFISTTAVMTRLSPASKATRLAAEETVCGSSLDWTIIRPTMIYGAPDDRNMARLLRFLRRSPVVPLPGGGRAVQQPVHVDDLSAAICDAVGMPTSVGKTYIMAGPEPLPLRDVIRQAASAVNRRPRLIPVPLAPAIALVAAYERASRNPRLRAEQITRLAEDKAFDIASAVADLGFQPRSFAVGINDEAALL